MKILVADDDAVSRRMMQRMLLGSGYEVTTAQDGAEAVSQLLDESGPRLVLLDWMMPRLDGPEVCRQIRSSAGRPYVYITLLTSKESKEDLVAGLEAGADDYLTKPCNSGELRARLRTGERILSLEDSLVTAREAMRFDATHDALTSLLNRGAILSSLNLELQRAQTTEVGLSILLSDVDHFKHINDTYGHPVGDEVLREIAARLKRCVRRGDRVGRYGGEEFFLILADCECKDLRLRAEQIRAVVGSTPVLTTAGPLEISISVGALEVSAANRFQAAERLLKDVDEALYRAKKEGRNRISVAEIRESTPMKIVVAPKLALCS